ncbi:helix-turn-helix domain-containing protein [Planococcus lenghuensis]|uniref:HTH cro/C1-type domain-containing protein n=1 Tax=Planococcus lenghuensis TaxID=2213202 RepID=A0A1Q2L2T9_9BACL|nr:helix-turn-helix domain-containing protein [Planococcus lenghuensis]AQQ54751.1 hypothetical protein B0X71_17680 [Planococcus lenghuensis]
MNHYLLSLGGSFAEIRQVLNLTQDDLANLIGVSRPTIVKIEQDPSRLTKTVAYAFFVAISYELQKRIEEVEKIDPEQYKDPESIYPFANKIKGASVLSTGAIVTISGLATGALLPGIGLAFAAAAGLKYASLKQKMKDDLRGKVELEKWDENKARIIIEEVKKKLSEDRKRVTSYFQIGDLNTVCFVKKVKESEQVYDKSTDAT